MNIVPAAQPVAVTPTPEDEVPSSFTHGTYAFSNEDGSGYDDNKMLRVGDTNNPNRQAQCVGSGITGTETTIQPKPAKPLRKRQPEANGWSQHTVMLDLDIPATLTPSSTPGHSHLYIDLPIAHDKYMNLLKALLEAGIIEQGFYNSAVNNGQTYLRMPGIIKKKNATPA